LDFIAIRQIFALDSFFGKIHRAKLFEMTDFKVPDITINFDEEELNNFYLTYQCECDMNARYQVRNENCYKAPWMDYDYAMNKAIKHNIIDISSIKNEKDFSIINKTNITFSEFEHIITKYTNRTLETVLTTSSSLFKIPTYSTDNVGLSFKLDE